MPLTGTTAEELSKYFAEFIKKELYSLNLDDSIDWIEATVNEGIGQGATYRVIFENK